MHLQMINFDHVNSSDITSKKKKIIRNINALSFELGIFQRLKHDILIELSFGFTYATFVPAYNDNFFWHEN